MEQGSDKRVQVQSSRPLFANKIFKDKTPEEVLAILPMLYSICGHAQAQAAEMACLHAQGVVLPEENSLTLARDILVLFESAKEHLGRILIDWPAYLDETEYTDELKEIIKLSGLLKQNLFKASITYGKDSISHVNLEQAMRLFQCLDDFLQRTIYAISPDEWFAITDLDELFAWIKCGDTVASRLLKQINQLGLGKLAITDTIGLPDLDDMTLLNMFTASDAERFIRAPSWNGKPCETTPLVRQKNHVLLKILSREYSNGLLTRLVSRLLELAEIPARLKGIIAQFDTISSHNQMQPCSDSGIGIGQVAAARGQLIHYVELQGGVVEQYQILAPTEWNFHPSGIVAKGLQTLTTRDEIQLRKQADMLINAIDPCVSYDIVVH